MPFYFRKSKKFGPFRITASKSGISASVGVKGARITHSRRGTHYTIGGNGLYYRGKIAKPSAPAAPPPPQPLPNYQRAAPPHRHRPLPKPSIVTVLGIAMVIVILLDLFILLARQ